MSKSEKSNLLIYNVDCKWAKEFVKTLAKDFQITRVVPYSKHSRFAYFNEVFVKKLFMADEYNMILKPRWQNSNLLLPELFEKISLQPYKYIYSYIYLLNETTNKLEIYRKLDIKSYF